MRWVILLNEYVTLLSWTQYQHFCIKKTEMILETNKEYIYMDKFDNIVVWVLMEIGLSIFLEFVGALIIV